MYEDEENALNSGRGRIVTINRGDNDNFNKLRAKRSPADQTNAASSGALPMSKLDDNSSSSNISTKVCEILVNKII